jgi:1-acyl-sn-glycerol-3-phosphate acyltransferase
MSPRRTDPRPASDAFYFFIHRLVNWLARRLWRYTLEGAENIPAGGAYLVVTNHLSVFDAPVVFMTVPVRTLMFGADKWRRVPLVSALIERVGVIWVTRGEADMDAIKAALNVLKSGGRLGVAPEGTRSPTGALQPGKPGAAYLADRARVPIVPMVMTGTETVVRSWRRLRRPVVTCRVGPPFMLPGDGRAKGARLDAFTDEIMCTLAALLPPEYRGVYAHHPLLRAKLSATHKPATPQAEPGA